MRHVCAYVSDNRLIMTGRSCICFMIPWRGAYLVAMFLSACFQLASWGTAVCRPSNRTARQEASLIEAAHGAPILSNDLRQTLLSKVACREADQLC